MCQTCSNSSCGGCGPWTLPTGPTGPTGQQGHAGTNGTNGTNGTDGTSMIYNYVFPPVQSPASSPGGTLISCVIPANTLANNGVGGTPVSNGDMVEIETIVVVTNNAATSVITDKIDIKLQGVNILNHTFQNPIGAGPGEAFKFKIELHRLSDTSIAFVVDKYYYDWLVAGWNKMAPDVSFVNITSLVAMAVTSLQANAKTLTLEVTNNSGVRTFTCSKFTVKKHKIAV